LAERNTVFVVSGRVVAGDAPRLVNRQALRGPWEGGEGITGRVLLNWWVWYCQPYKQVEHMSQVRKEDKFVSSREIGFRSGVVQ
jgi:hypothetical protein